MSEVVGVVLSSKTRFDLMYVMRPPPLVFLLGVGVLSRSFLVTE